MIVGLVRLALLAACLAALPATAVGAPAASLELSAEQQALLAAYPVLRLGVESDWPPIEFISPNGAYSGVISSYMRSVEKSLGIRFELVRKDTWAEVLEAFARGEIDVISALGETEARREAMRFTEPYIRFTDGIIVRNDEPYIERLSDFPAGKRLAAVQGYGSSERAASNHPHLLVVPVRSTEEALLAVSTGRADIAVASLASAYYLTQSQGLSNLRVAANFDEYQQSMAMALRPGLEAMVPIFNAALAAITPGERESMRALWTKVEIDRGVARKTVLIWSAAALLALLLMGGWVAWLLSQQRQRQWLLQRAEDAESQFRTMIGAMPALFWTLRINAGQPTQLTFYGDRAVKLAGFEPGTTLIGFDEATRYMGADDRLLFQQRLESHGRSNKPIRFEHLVTRGPAEGTWVFLQALPRREKGGIVWYGCTSDISERKRLNLALEQSRNQLVELAAGVPGALWQFRSEPDGTQQYSYMSDGIIGITGRTPAETNQLLLDNSFESVHPDDLDIVHALMQRLTERPGIDEARYRLRTADGNWKWVQVAARAMPVGDDGTLVWNGVTLDASRIHQTEEALRYERQSLQDLADNLSGALWRLRRWPDGSLHFDYISEGVVAVAGRTAAEIMSEQRLPLDEIVAEDKARVLAAFDASAESGQPMEIEYSVRSASGSLERLFARAAVRFEDGHPVWTGVLFNVSERHRLQAELTETRTQLEDITNTFPGAIWQMRRSPGESERFTYMSENIRMITGRPPEATLDTPGLPFKVMVEEDRERVRALMEKTALTPGSAHIDYRLTTITGEPRWVTASFTVRRQADGTVVWNGLLTDASETKQLEADLRAASEEAEAASRAKTRFLSNMSHEIRTPMNAVIGLAHIAMTSETNPLQAERIGKIHRAGKTLLKLLNDILEYARLDAGKLTPLIAPFDLGELREGLQLFCLQAAETKGLGFAIDCPAHTPLHWLGDATRIQQVLLNLLTNAIKFTDAGTVTLAIEAVPGPKPGLRFAVRDTGIGMTPQELQRVFEAFEQASGEIERRYGGSGLGLSISRELVQALGGTIAVESTPGEGSLFTVWLPLQPASALLSKPQGDLEQRLSRLADHIHNNELGGARASLRALRLALIPEGREPELHHLERLLSSFDFEAAAVELAQLRMRWRSG
ncbi:MAG: transporter substrate-binding domain-containing protein [Pseudomonadota bacterium]